MRGVSLLVDFLFLCGESTSITGELSSIYHNVMSASSQHPNINEHQEWGWKRQWGSPVARSGPGAPPRERTRVYDQPWNTLTPLQRAAAHNCLGIVNEVAWEMAMPRRLYACCESTVLTFQPVSWNGLTAQQQQDAQKHLQISKEVWNEQSCSLS